MEKEFNIDVIEKAIYLTHLYLTGIKEITLIERQALGRLTNGISKALIYKDDKYLFDFLDKKFCQVLNDSEYNIKYTHIKFIK